MKKLNVRFSDMTQADIQHLCDSMDISFSVVARAAIQVGIDQIGKAYHSDGVKVTSLMVKSKNKESLSDEEVIYQVV